MIEKLDKHLASNINSCNMAQNIMVAHKAIEKINALVDAVNGILDYAPLEMAMKAKKPNIDIGELAYLQKENSDLKDELERTRKALDVAVDALKEYEDRDSYDCNGDWCGCEYSTAHKALEQITALEQKDVK